MESRRVWRDNTKIYKDLIYVWCYMPQSFKYMGTVIENHRRKKVMKTVTRAPEKITEKSLYKKHICGIGFYTRYHARHVLIEYFGVDILSYVHTISGKKLIQMGITDIPKRYSDRIFYKGSLRRVRKWVYPPEFNYDSHRRRHFILYLVRSAEDYGKSAFNTKYKRYFNGYQQSFPVSYYIRKRKKVLGTLLQKIREANT